MHQVLEALCLRAGLFSVSSHRRWIMHLPKYSNSWTELVELCHKSVMVIIKVDRSWVTSSEPAAVSLKQFLIKAALLKHFIVGVSILSIFCYCIDDAFRVQEPFRYMILLHDGVSSVQHSIIMKTRKNSMKHR